MEQPTEEQTKKFWEHFGFKHHTYPERWTLNHVSIEGARWITPDKCGAIIDLPTLDLNNIFKYAVPKLMEDGWACRVQSSPLRDNDTGKTIFEWSGYAEVFYIRYDKPLSHKNNYYAINPEPAIALFWAIWEASELSKGV